MTSADIRREVAPFALMCPACKRGPVAAPRVLRNRIESCHYVCDACGHREPVERSYLAAQRTLPFTNVPLVSNRWEVGVTTIPVGRLHTVKVSDGLKALDWVTASANAQFPAVATIVGRSSDSFTVIVGTEAEPREQLAQVAWSAAGTDQGNRFFFFEALSRAMHALHRDSLRQDQNVRVSLLEAVTAYEIFLAWFLREVVWKHRYFEQSATKGKAIDDMIRDAGVFNLTSVTLRVAYQRFDPYRIFDLLQFQTVGGLLTVDDTIGEMLAGIQLRNKVAHRGLTGVDEALVEQTVTAAYRLMEIGILNLPARTSAEETRADVA